MKKPRSLNKLRVDARINKSQRGHYIKIDAGGCLTPAEVRRLIEWLTKAQAWIKLEKPV